MSVFLLVMLCFTLVCVTLTLMTCLAIIVFSWQVIKIVIKKCLGVDIKDPSDW